jgi:hypothetical protein
MHYFIFFQNDAGFFSSLSTSTSLISLGLPLLLAVIIGVIPALRITQVHYESPHSPIRAEGLYSSTAQSPFEIRVHENGSIDY